MANLFFKDGKWWLNYRIDGRRFRRSTGTSNKKLAEAKLKELEVSLFKGEIPDKQAPLTGSSLPDFFRRFVEYAKNNYSNQHLQSDLSRINIMQEFFARKGVRNLHTLRRQFTTLARELGLKGTLHDLRHTFASHLAMESVPIPVIKDLLGHSDISTTMIYAPLSPDHNRAAIDKLPF